MPMNTPNELKPLTGTLETVVSETGDRTLRRARQLRGNVNITLRTAKNAIAEVSATTAETLKSAAASADEYVHENPWIAIGVTACVAAAVGYLAGRSGQRRH
jgi:ElaB/YqjD/DUF883 family membrane-anchored ribosome-binding protein